VSTNCFVGVKVGDKIKFNYVHWDGYYNGVGAELLKKYDGKSYLKIIKQGNLSSLVDGVVSYKAMGRKGNQVKSYITTEQEYFNDWVGMVPYAYLFVNGHWIVYQYEDGWNFLKDVVTEEPVCEVA
jgi:hypothetical protein